MVDSKRQGWRCGFSQGHVAGQDHDRHALFGNSRSHGDAKHAGYLFGLRDQFAVVAAVLEEVLGVRLLEVRAAELSARYLSRNREHGHTTAMTVVKAVDQVEVSGPATACAY